MVMYDMRHEERVSGDGKERGLRSRLCVRALLLVLCVGSGLAEGQSRHRSSWDDISDLYNSDKVEEAFDLLKKTVQEKTVAVERLKKGQGPERNVGMLVVAGDVGYGVRRFVRGLKGWPVSEELCELCTKAVALIDQVVEEVEKTPVTEDERRMIEMAKDTKMDLLVTEVRALRDSGEHGKARVIVEENADFFGDRKSAVEALLFVPVTEKKETIGPGAALPVVQVLLGYYKALASENPSEIDAYLCVGEGVLTGKDIVERLDAEREMHESSDALVKVSFDARTSLEVIPRGGNEYKVMVYEVVKTVRLKKQQITQREMDQFMVKVVDGKYKLYFGKTQKSEKLVK